MQVYKYDYNVFYTSRLRSPRGYCMAALCPPPTAASWPPVLTSTARLLAEPLSSPTLSRLLTPPSELLPIKYMFYEKGFLLSVANSKVASI